MLHDHAQIAQQLEPAIILILNLARKHGKHE